MPKTRAQAQNAMSEERATKSAGRVGEDEPA